MRRAAPLLLLLLLPVPAAAQGPAPEPAPPLEAPVELKPPGELTPPPRAPAQATPDADARLRELAEAQRRLEHRLEVAESLAAGRARATPAMGLGPEGFYLGTPESGFQLRMRGVLQADGRFYAGAGSGALTDAFLVRRARLYMEGVVANFFDFRLLPDFGEGRLTLFEAWVNLRPRSWLQLRAGKMKSPFGLERLQAEQNVVFVERGLPSDLAPDRDLGVALHGRAADVLTWHLAVLNGAPDSANYDVEPSSAKDLAARLFLNPLRSLGTPLAGLGVGVAATIGWERGTEATPAVPVYRTTGQQVFFSYLAPGGGPPVLAHGTRRRLSPQAAWYAGPAGLLAEYVVSEQEVARGTARTTLTHRAFGAQLSVLLTGDEASYDGVQPRHAFDLDRGQLGAVELAARYGEIRIDDAAFPAFADPAASARRARAAGFAANWYFNRNVRFGANVERTVFEGGAPGGDRDPELAILERLQVSF